MHGRGDVPVKSESFKNARCDFNPRRLPCQWMLVHGCASRMDSSWLR